LRALKMAFVHFSLLLTEKSWDTRKNRLRHHH
jgi:hypothetical protein